MVFPGLEQVRVSAVLPRTASSTPFLCPTKQDKREAREQTVRRVLANASLDIKSLLEWCES